MIEKPLVSIIVGAYNCEKTIDKCINSVLNQTYKNWELIICDDCSKDRTLEKLIEYQYKDKRIKVLKNKENLQLAATLNKCLRYVKGKYIARLDTDDECINTRFEKQVNFLEKNKNIAVVGSARIIYDENGEKGVLQSIEYPNKNILLKDVPFAHPTIMMRREIYESLGGYSADKDTRRCEDLELWFRFYEKGYMGYNLQEPLYKYHLDINDYKKRNIKAAIGTSKIFLKGYSKIGVPKYKYIYALKPIISALIPNFIIYFWHIYKKIIKGDK